MESNISLAAVICHEHTKLAGKAGIAVCDTSTETAPPSENSYDKNYLFHSQDTSKELMALTVCMDDFIKYAQKKGFRQAHVYIHNPGEAAHLIPADIQIGSFMLHVLDAKDMDKKYAFLSNMARYALMRPQ